MLGHGAWNLSTQYVKLLLAGSLLKYNLGIYSKIYRAFPVISFNEFSLCLKACAINCWETCGKRDGEIGRRMDKEEEDEEVVKEN